MLDDATPAQLIDAKLAELGDWRGELLGRLRELIHRALPDVVEQVKWRKPTNPSGVPTWEQDGIICTGEIYRDKVKLTFARGATVEDPTRIFNASLDAGTRRAIDLRQGDDVDADAFVALVRSAADRNAAA